MTTPPFSTAQIIEAFGTTAHSAIGAWRAGGERLGQVAAQRWDQAFEQAKPRLSAETRRNATRTRKVVARYWRQGLDLSTTGAGTAVDTLVQAAGTALERAEALRQSRANRA
jgi:ABC-type hemin transport system substrate-binding protein